MAVQSGVYRGVPARKRVADRRARLLEAALEIWADPARRTTMTAVCAEAGLTERYFYESFSGLDEVLRTVLEGVAEEIEETVVAAAEAVGEDPVARAQAAMTALVDLIAGDPRKGRVAIVEAGAMPELRRRRTELLRHLAHRTSEEARAWLNLPEQSAAENELAGLLFVGGMAELITAWLDGAITAEPADIVEAAAHAFLRLYA